MHTRSQARREMQENIDVVLTESNRDENESDSNGNLTQAVGKLCEEVRSFREDVLVHAWINSNRLDLMETILEKVADVTGKLVNMVEKVDARVQALEKNRRSPDNAAFGLVFNRAERERVRKNLLPLFEKY